MKAIVNVDNNWGIGSDNDLLYHIPADMKFFKEHTTGNVVVMGKATVLSLPGQKPLPNRTTIALSTDKSWNPEGIFVAHSIEELLQKLEEYDSDSVYICGGESIYKQLIDKCDTAYVTKVFAGDKKAEKFFPNLDKKPEWKITYKSEIMEHKDIKFQFTEYTK